MDNNEISQKCQKLLTDLDKPSFIVFGYEKDDKSYGVVYATHKTPPSVAVKGMSWALHDLAKKKL